MAWHGAMGLPRMPTSDGSSTKRMKFWLAKVLFFLEHSPLLGRAYKPSELVSLCPLLPLSSCLPPLSASDLAWKMFHTGPVKHLQTPVIKIDNKTFEVKKKKRPVHYFPLHTPVLLVSSLYNATTVRDKLLLPSPFYKWRNRGRGMLKLI